ncbi:MAG: ATP-binding protein [Gammaproteobacteria bacterium]|nr:ATP-binding protein [Gammaproteobacteria bacterium]
MNSPSTTIQNAVADVADVSRPCGSASEQLRREVGLLAGRFASLLRSRFSGAEQPVVAALAFLDYAYAAVSDNGIEPRASVTDYPLERLVLAFELSPCEIDLLLLAGMAEEHEGYADIFRTLHPTGQPYPTVGLAAQLICGNDDERVALRELLASGEVTGSGVLQVSGDGPFYSRNLVLLDQLWPTLHGIDAWPQSVVRLTQEVMTHGLQQWLDSADVLGARQALQSNNRCTVLLCADDEAVAVQRAMALLNAAQLDGLPIQLPQEHDATLDALIQIHCLVRGVVPVLKVPHQEGDKRAVLPVFSRYPYPLVMCGRVGCGEMSGERPLVNLVVAALSPVALRDMWRGLLPEMAEQASLLAARYPVEPVHAAQLVRDLRFNHRFDAHDQAVAPFSIEHVAARVRARSATTIGGGVQLIRPVADWSQLVLAEAKLAQLSEAVNRLELQAKVLDEWRFLNGRRGARGVRMLFAGPSGTGKTLSAEVLANALGVDLLMVDLSKVVSKWIGETEKNLAEVFDVAERAKAVLLFDEADALFGKRTEVADAHDRYANLETAYLLSRLERFDGLAILSTNLRQNIDSAFIRRLEFIVEFEEPAREQRFALWRCHLPQGVPVADDVCLEQLAAQFPIVGGLIRNAAVAAAFLAAGEGDVISKRHFIQAIRREYEKTGKAYRDVSSAAAQRSIQAFNRRE